MLGYASLTAAFLLIVFAALFVARTSKAGLKRDAVLASVGTVLIAALTYLMLGQPTLPSLPFQDRVGKVQAQLRAGDSSELSTEAVMAMLQDRMRLEPSDPRPHAFYGRLLMSEGRYDEALRAFFAALRRDPKFADALAGAGQCLLAIDGAPTPAAIAALEAAMAAMPEDEPRRARIGMMVQALKPLLSEQSKATPTIAGPAPELPK